MVFIHTLDINSHFLGLIHNHPPWPPPFPDYVVLYTTSPLWASMYFTLLIGTLHVCIIWRARNKNNLTSFCTCTKYLQWEGGTCSQDSVHCPRPSEDMDIWQYLHHTGPRDYAECITWTSLNMIGRQIAVEYWSARSVCSPSYFGCQTQLILIFMSRVYIWMRLYQWLLFTHNLVNLINAFIMKKQIIWFLSNIPFGVCNFFVWILQKRAYTFQLWRDWHNL